jgi:hypothetical protein
VGAEIEGPLPRRTPGRRLAEVGSPRPHLSRDWPTLPLLHVAGVSPVPVQMWRGFEPRRSADEVAAWRLQGTG